MKGQFIRKVANDFETLINELKIVVETINDIGLANFIKDNYPPYICSSFQNNTILVNIAIPSSAIEDITDEYVILHDKKLVVPFENVNLDMREMDMFFFLTLKNTKVLRHIMIIVDKTHVWFETISKAFNSIKFLSIDPLATDIVESVLPKITESGESIIEITFKSNKIPIELLLPEFVQFFKQLFNRSSQNPLQLLNKTLQSFHTPQFNRYILPVRVKLVNLDPYICRGDETILRTTLANNFIIGIDQQNVIDKLSYIGSMIIPLIKLIDQKAKENGFKAEFDLSNYRLSFECRIRKSLGDNGFMIVTSFFNVLSDKAIQKYKL